MYADCFLVLCWSIRSFVLCWLGRWFEKFVPHPLSCDGFVVTEFLPAGDPFIISHTSSQSSIPCLFGESALSAETGNGAILPSP
jgi:hypothetical protein